MIGKLATKIAAASNDVGGKLNPDKRNQDQKYDYVSADKILAVCGQALASQGVVVFPGITKSEIAQVDRGSGKWRYDATIELGITVTDGETEYACAWMGLGSDYMTPDKALYKAVTSGHKYFLMKLLNVGAGNEDGEHEAHEAPRQRKEQPTPRQQSQPQPANGAGAQPQPTNPPGFQVWADWRHSDDAIAWGMSQGVFTHQKHAENAYAKCKDAAKPANAKAMWQAWFLDVNQRSHAKSAGKTILDAVEAAADEHLDVDPVTEGDWLDEPQFS